MPGKPARPSDAVQVAGDQIGQEQEQAAELGAEVRGATRSSWRTSATSPAVGRARGGPLLVAAAGQAGEALVPGGCWRHGDGAERLAVACQGPADVVDGEVLLAQGDDLLAAGIGAWALWAAVWPGRKKAPVGSWRNWWTRTRKLPGRVAEAAGGLGGGKALDEEGAQGLVLAVGGVGGGEEVAGRMFVYSVELINIVPRSNLRPCKKLWNPTHGRNAGLSDTFWHSLPGVFHAPQ